jgi:hypothetical protein
MSAKAGRTFQIAVTHRIPERPEAVYGVFADYREAHPRILPSFFTGLEVEQGGHGAGTVILVKSRFAGRTRVIRGIVSEPEPGRVLVESYPEEKMVTTFRVVPAGNGASTVTISTIVPRRGGILGWVEERLARRLLTRVFAEELDLVAGYLARRNLPPAMS